MNKILITGASGFIGRRLATSLSSQRTVTALGRSPVEGAWETFITHDIASGESLPEQACEGVDTVYHLASKAHALSETVGATDGYDDVIVGGTEAVVRAAEAAGVASLVYLSSVKAMGEGSSTTGQDTPITESEAAAPQTPYGQAKLKAEAIVLQSQIPHVVIVRPVMVYGAGQKGNLDRMAAAIRGKRFPPIPENGNRRSMVHVDNLVAACNLLAVKTEANRKKYIISEPNPRSTRQLYDQLRVELGLKPIGWSVPIGILRMGAKLGDLGGRLVGRRMPLDSDSLQKLVGSAWYSGERITEEFGFRYESFSLLGDL